MAHKIKSYRNLRSLFHLHSLFRRHNRGDLGRNHPDSRRSLSHNLRGDHRIRLLCDLHIHALFRNHRS